MTRIKIIVEGQTEESFINNLLSPTLWPRQIHVTPILLGIPGRKGGNVNYARVKKDILLHLKQDPTAYCSTMLDLYGLGNGFPGMPIGQDQTGHRKAQVLERALLEDILAAVPERRPDERFHPYLQVHEFEALLFSAPDVFARALGRESISNDLQAIRDAFPTPEDIDDSPLTAPSKRVLGLYGSYKKVLEGTVAAGAVGISNMREHCPHFDEWVRWLESVTPLE